jgi:acyl-coenzyme A synthetase/AMP-(fatty) acid ligase
VHHIQRKQLFFLRQWKNILTFTSKSADSIKSRLQVTEKELMDLVANNFMDTHKLRAGVVFLSTFPYTGSGKIARIQLKEIAKKLANY